MKTFKVAFVRLNFRFSIKS